MNRNRDLAVIDVEATEVSTPAQQHSFDIDSVRQRYKAIIDLQRSVMKKGIDYDQIGRNQNATLLKPGAEKLAILFGLRVSYEAVKTVENWDGGFFYYHYKALLKNSSGAVVGEGEGSCNTKEKKYRWSWQTRSVKPPQEEADLLVSSGEGRWRKIWVTQNGRRSEQWAFQDRIENPDVFDLVNTVQKMAQKRALVAAVLVTVGASELFTQDLEDFEDQLDAGSPPPVEVVIEQPPAPTGPVDYSDDPQWKKLSARFHQLTNGDLQTDFKRAFKRMHKVDSVKHIEPQELRKMVARLANRQKHQGDAGVVEAMELMIDKYGGASQ